MLRLSSPNDAANWGEDACAFAHHPLTASPEGHTAPEAFVSAFVDMLRLRDVVQARLAATQLSLSQRLLVQECASLSQALIVSCQKFLERDMSELPRVVERALDPADSGSVGAQASVKCSLTFMRAIMSHLQDDMLSHEQVQLLGEHDVLCEKLERLWQAGVRGADATTGESPIASETDHEQEDDVASQNLWDLLELLVSRLAEAPSDLRRRVLRQQIDDVLSTLKLGNTEVVASAIESANSASQSFVVEEIAYLEDIFEAEDETEAASADHKWTATPTEDDDSFILEDVHEALIEDVFFDLDAAELKRNTPAEILDVVDIDVELPQRSAGAWS